MRHPLCALATVTFTSLLAPSAAVADQQFQFDVKTTKHVHASPADPSGKSAPQTKPVDEVHEGTVATNVTLGPTYFVVDTPDKETIYDFAAMQMSDLDRKKQESIDADIHAIACFKVCEFQNREVLSQLLSKSGVKGAAASDFDLQSTFGLQLPGGPAPRITVKQDGTTTHYLHDGKEVATTVASDQAIDPSLRKTFQRFLAQQTKLHPVIRRKIGAETNMPSTLTYSYADVPMEEGTITYNLKGEKTVAPPNTAPPANYKLQRSPNVAGIFKALEALGTNPQFETRESAGAAAQQAARSQNNLDAVLILTEYALETGDQSGVEMSELAPKVGLDQKVQTFQTHLNPQSKEQVEAAIEALTSLDRHGLTRGYIIDVMLGNIYLENGDPEKATQSMLSALTQNPLLMGVYNDLGMILIARYDTAGAWDLFNVARKLRPHHPQLEAVNQTEKKMEADFPDLF